MDTAASSRSTSSETRARRLFHLDATMATTPAPVPSRYDDHNLISPKLRPPDPGSPRPSPRIAPHTASSPRAQLTEVAGTDAVPRNSAARRVPATSPLPQMYVVGTLIRLTEHESDFDYLVEGPV